MNLTITPTAMMTFDQFREAKLAGQPVYLVAPYNYHFRTRISNTRPNGDREHLVTTVTKLIVAAAGKKEVKFICEGSGYCGHKEINRTNLPYDPYEHYFLSLDEAADHARLVFDQTLAMGSDVPVKSHKVVQRQYTVFGKNFEAYKAEEPALISCRIIDGDSTQVIELRPMDVIAGDDFEGTAAVVSVDVAKGVASVTRDFHGSEPEDWNLVKLRSRLRQGLYTIQPSHQFTQHDPQIAAEITTIGRRLMGELIEMTGTDTEDTDGITATPSKIDLFSWPCMSYQMAGGNILHAAATFKGNTSHFSELYTQALESMESLQTEPTADNLRIYMGSMCSLASAIEQRDPHKTYTKQEQESWNAAWAVWKMSTPKKKINMDPTRSQSHVVIGFEGEEDGIPVYVGSEHDCQDYKEVMMSVGKSADLFEIEENPYPASAASNVTQAIGKVDGGQDNPQLKQELNKFSIDTLGYITDSE